MVDKNLKQIDVFKILNEMVPAGHPFRMDTKKAQKPDEIRLQPFTKPIK